MQTFPTSYSDIKARIAAVNPARYASSRNFIDGAVTYLSPYISRGVISVADVSRHVLSSGFTFSQWEKLLQELAWREYFQRVWQHKGQSINEDLHHPQQDVIHHKMPSSILHANTGILSIDAAINQLYENGYMHNHIRMYVASLACNVAKAHWHAPSRWMYYHLLDHDLASNNCSWQWVAGSFSTKKYYFNQENVNKYTKSNQRQTFMDKSYEDLIKMDVPAVLVESEKPALSTSLPVTALPAIDISKPTLLYTSYNLDPLWRSNELCNRVLILEPSHFQQYPVSESIIEFIVNLSKNIKGIQIYCGEIEDIISVYQKENVDAGKFLISKEHPFTNHFPGKKDARNWMFPEVAGYYKSFFAFWKKAEKTF